MNLFKKVLITGCIVLGSASASAEFIKGDWLAVGDNLTVVDKTSGLEWLSLGQTTNQKVSKTISLLDTTYDGWRLPTRSEIRDMFYNQTGFGPVDYGSWDLDGSNSSIATTFINNMGTTATSYSAGVYVEGNDVFYISASYVDSENAQLSTGSKIATNYNFYSPSLGMFLVSDGGLTLASMNDPSINANNANASSVPLPASVGLLALAMLGFSARRK